MFICLSKRIVRHCCKTEHKVYKRRTILKAAAELTVALLLKLLTLDNLFFAVIYLFTVLSLMLIAGKAKNHFRTME